MSDADFDIERRYVHATMIIRRAGMITWDYFTRGVPVESKSDETPVTVADRECEEFLRRELSSEFPGDGFLGEEHGEEPSTTGFRWIIDPIDATANFIRGIPIYGNLVGLEFNGDLVAGICYVPGSNDLYRAMRGRGAFKNDRPIHVSSIATIEEAQLVYPDVTKFDRHGLTEFFLSMARTVKRVRGFGDYWNFLQVAEGASDIVLEPIAAAWDLAALVPIVEEAGGVFTDFKGERTWFGGCAVAANPALHRLVMDRLKRESPS